MPGLVNQLPVAFDVAGDLGLEARTLLNNPFMGGPIRGSRVWERGVR
jgi:hypothetical protein